MSAALDAIRYSHVLRLELRLELVDRLERAHERLLQDVLRIGLIAHHPQREPVDPRRVFFHKLGISRLVPGTQPLEQRCIRVMRWL